MRVGGSHGLPGKLRWLVSALCAGHEPWAGRCRAQLHGLMVLSDRALADIGVRRADVLAAMSGMLPIEHIARTHPGWPWTAEIRPLRRASSEARAADDMSAAA